MPIDIKRHWKIAWITLLLVAILAVIALWWAGYSLVKATVERSDRDMMVAFACGYVIGNHDAHEVVRLAPAPHVPQSNAFCDRVRKLALEHGWKQPK